MIKVLFQDVGALDEYNFGLVNGLISHANLSVTVGASTVTTFMKGLRFKSCLKDRGKGLRIALMNPPKSDRVKWAAAKSLGPLYVEYFSSFDVLHLNNASSPWLSPALRAKVSKIFTFHDHMVAEEQDSTKLNTLSHILGRMNFVTTPNEFMAEILKEKSGCEPIVIPHGINTNLFNSSIPQYVARNHLGISSIKKVIFWNSRLSPEKHLETLVDAMPKVVKEMPSVLFLIHGRAVGESRYRRNVLQYARRKIKEAGIESNVRFVFKRLPHEDMVFHYRSADLFVHTSRLEAFGLVLAEAMACKVPVVAMDKLWSREVLGEAGGFFKQGNSQDLAERMVQLLADENLRKTLTEKAYKRVLENFNWKKAAREYLNLYQQCTRRS